MDESLKIMKEVEEVKLKKKKAEDEYHAMIPRHAHQQQKLKACEVRKGRYGTGGRKSVMYVKNCSGVLAYPSNSVTFLPPLLHSPSSFLPPSLPPYILPQSSPFPITPLSFPSFSLLPS